MTDFKAALARARTLQSIRRNKGGETASKLKENGFSVREIADALGVPKSTVHRDLAGSKAHATNVSSVAEAEQESVAKNGVPAEQQNGTVAGLYGPVFEHINAVPLYPLYPVAKNNESQKRVQVNTLHNNRLGAAVPAVPAVPACFEACPPNSGHGNRDSVDIVGETPVSDEREYPLYSPATVPAEQQNGAKKLEEPKNYRVQRVQRDSVDIVGENLYPLEKPKRVQRDSVDIVGETPVSAKNEAAVAKQESGTVASQEWGANLPPDEAARLAKARAEVRTGINAPETKPTDRGDACAIRGMDCLMAFWATLTREERASVGGLAAFDAWAKIARVADVTKPEPSRPAWHPLPHPRITREPPYGSDGAAPVRYRGAWGAALARCPDGMRPVVWECAMFDAARLFGDWGIELDRLGWQPDDLFGLPHGLVWVMRGNYVAFLGAHMAQMNDDRVWRKMP